MKILLLTFVLFTHLLAYQKGDLLSPEMAAHLGLEKNKLYVIDFFASWCGSCQKEIPLICSADKKIDHTKIEIIGIDVDQKPQQGIAFQKGLKEQHHLKFKIVNDPQNLVISKFAPVGMPTLYYVKNRKVLKVITGAVDEIDQQILDDPKEME